MEKYGASELRAGNRKSVGLEEQAKYSKTDIESAITGKLQKFLLELGKGYFFEARQKRFSYDEKTSKTVCALRRQTHCPMNDRRSL